MHAKAMLERPGKSGVCLIMIRYRHRVKDTKFTTGETIDPVFFNKRKGHVNHEHPNAFAINAIIDKVKKQLF
jgi:hypothetical protein